MLTGYAEQNETPSEYRIRRFRQHSVNANSSNATSCYCRVVDESRARPPDDDFRGRIRATTPHASKIARARRKRRVSPIPFAENTASLAIGHTYASMSSVAVTKRRRLYASSSNKTHNITAVRSNILRRSDNRERLLSSTLEIRTNTISGMRARPLYYLTGRPRCDFAAD